MFGATDAEWAWERLNGGAVRRDDGGACVRVGCVAALAAPYAYLVRGVGLCSGVPLACFVLSQRVASSV